MKFEKLTTFTIGQVMGVRQANKERISELLRFADHISKETFSKAKSYEELLGKIVALKRQARQLLKGKAVTL